MPIRWSQGADRAAAVRAGVIGRVGQRQNIYGMAAGAFFWGYFLFEVPSNIILEKLGARIWIARIMITWGLKSGATAFCVGGGGPAPGTVASPRCAHARAACV